MISPRRFVGAVSTMTTLAEGRMLELQMTAAAVMMVNKPQMTLDASSIDHELLVTTGPPTD